MAMPIYAKLRAGVVTTSAAQTQALAAELAAALPDDAILALHGDLGVGKTTFTQGLARAFGIETPVTSPTFNLYTTYLGKNGRTVVHLDAYRIENERQFDDLMIEDFLSKPYCLVVEWPEKIATWLPARTLHLTLSIESPGQHRVVLT